MATPSTRRYAPRLPPEERREQLLDAALRRIAEHGWAGASMEAVAREAGVTKPVVYDLFPNRGELLRAVLEREEGRAAAALGEAMPLPPPADANPEDLLVDGVVAFLRSVAANPWTWRLILLPADGTPDLVREQVEAGRAQAAAQLEQLISWGVERLGGPTDLDIELAARGLQAFGEQAARLVIAEPDRWSAERVGDFARSLIGMLGPGGSGAGLTEAG